MELCEKNWKKSFDEILSELVCEPIQTYTASYPKYETGTKTYAVVCLVSAHGAGELLQLRLQCLLLPGHGLTSHAGCPWAPEKSVRALEGGPRPAGGGGLQNFKNAKLCPRCIALLPKTASLTTTNPKQRTARHYETRDPKFPKDPNEFCGFDPPVLALR